LACTNKYQNNDKAPVTIAIEHAFNSMKHRTC